MITYYLNKTRFILPVPSRAVIFSVGRVAYTMWSRTQPWR